MPLLGPRITGPRGDVVWYLICRLHGAWSRAGSMARHLLVARLGVGAWFGVRGCGPIDQRVVDHPVRSGALCSFHYL
jgi:hypothetical protein